MSEKYTWDWTRQLGKRKARVVVYRGEDVMLRLKMEEPDEIRPLVDDANRGAAAQQAQAAVDLNALRERVKEIIMNYELSEDDAGKQVDAAFDAALKPKEHSDAAQAADNP